MSPRRNWDSPKPSLACECAPPPITGGGGGAHSPAAKGVGESQFRRHKKKLSTLPTLWGSYTGRYWSAKIDDNSTTLCDPRRRKKGGSISTITKEHGLPYCYSSLMNSALTRANISVEDAVTCSYTIIRFEYFLRGLCKL
jgi:hypothetical protein